METITVVDARMGRGKSSAAIRYMKEHRWDKRFLYITPYLREVDRVCEQCGFEQPGTDLNSKSADLRKYLREGKHIAATHALFYLLDETALEIVRKKRYTLVIDENINIIGRFNISGNDLQVVTGQLADVGVDGRVRWRDPAYSGAFSVYKRAADAGLLYQLDGALVKMLDPDTLRAFEDVLMLTYLFGGQYQKAYLDYYGFKYRVVGVEEDGAGFRFSDTPDCPPPEAYGKLLTLCGNERMNGPGEERCALSKSWYSRRGYGSAEIRTLRNGMRNFFQDMTGSTREDRLWTCFKEDRDKLVDKRTGRYRSNFLQLGARATNDYRGRTNAAYMINRFADPNLKKFFGQRGCTVDEELFALSEMLQWIWRCAVRDGKPINLYIPSSRMRGLLTDWIEQNT